MSNYLNNLLARSRGLSTEVRPRLAHPFETFNVTTTTSAVSPISEVISEATEADHPRFSETPFVRTALEPPTPANVSTADSLSASSSAPAPSPQARALHRHEASARPGLAQERTQSERASAEVQSPERNFTKARRTSRRDRIFQLKRAEPGTTEPAQKSQPSLLHEQDAQQAVRERDDRLDAQVELDEISHRAEARVVNQRPDLKPALLDERPISTLSVQTENPAGATTAARRARAQTPSDARSFAGKVSTGDASSRQIVQRPSMVAPDVTRLENLAPTSNPPIAPTIRVTIGRIEVRAVMPPAMPAKERTRPAPKLSLDEYLRSQNGGKR
jgi:hypothetical protein